MKSQLVTTITKTDASNMEHILTSRGKIYTFLNPVSYLSALDHNDLFSSFDGIFADGSLLVKAIKRLYNVDVVRRSFDMTSIAPELFNFAQANSKSIYIVASKQDELERAMAIFKERYPNLIVAGCRNGYFSSSDETKQEVEKIVSTNPDYLIVGMGAVAQERFLLQVKQGGFQGVGFTCGGFVHQTSQNIIDYYPAWTDRLNVRFLYRMYKEQHTRKRYMQAAFLFPLRFIGEYVR